MKIRRCGDWLSAKVGDELVMMSAEKGNYLGLSDVGTRVWELIESPRDMEEICEQLEQEYDVPADVCRSEVRSFVNELVKHGAATFDTA